MELQRNELTTGENHRGGGRRSAGDGVADACGVAASLLIDQVSPFDRVPPTAIDLPGLMTRRAPSFGEGCMSKLLLSSAIVATTLAVMTPTSASAQVTYDKLTYLTFSGIVQVPGATLPAGTYRFHLTNPDTSRNVMQVLSYDGATVYSMFHTIPAWRPDATTDPAVTFKEVPADVPPPIGSMFYGGERNGYEFLYSNGPDLTALTAPQPPITYEPLPVVAEVAPPAPVFEPAAAPESGIAPAAEPEPAPAVELPKTATRVPVFAFTGVILLLAGLGLAWRVG